MLIERGRPLPEGADAADFAESGWTSAEVLAWLRARLIRPPAPPAEAVDPEQPPLPDGQDGPRPDEEGDRVEAQPGGGDEQPAAAPAVDAAPYICLGHNRGTYYYLSRAAKQVLALEGARHNKQGLLMLASLAHWTEHYPGPTGPAWTAAADDLMRRSEAAGIYDPMRVRGRGAWWEEDGRTVLHLGDRLVTDGQEHSTAGFRSRYIYEAAAPLRMASAHPLSSGEAVELLRLCELLPWERPIHARLLAGWCVVAPICGAMRWRPHVWITGPAGSGKSWIYEHILMRCLGDIAVAAASETTEAGLRQVLGTDARPVVFDEAEGETQRSASRIANVLALMRQASTESQACIYKGTSGGMAQRFVTRSCFAFASIGVGIQAHADQTRITVLPLTIDLTRTREERSAHFGEVIEPRQRSLLTDEYVDRLHARTIGLIPTIRTNARTFATAGASVIGTRRLGDQIGALLAGAYALHSSRAIGVEAAREWLAGQDWSEEALLQEQRDEVACLRHILEHPVSISTEHGGRQDRNVAELIRASAGIGEHWRIGYDDARDALSRIGLRVDDGVLYVANNHSALARILQATPWPRNWRLVLRRLEGAVPGCPAWFGGGISSRSVGIPLDTVFAGEDRSTPR